jgi:hypothetical protein
VTVLSTVPGTVPAVVAEPLFATTVRVYSVPFRRPVTVPIRPVAWALTASPAAGVATIS